MKEEILALQHRLKLHFENYDSLKAEEIYREYIHNKRIPSNDELDYLICQALCSMPQYAKHIELDAEWRLLNTLAKAFDVSATTDPQLAMIALVVDKREALNGCGIWLHSALYLYELIMYKNLANIHADLARIKHLKQIAEQAQQPKAPLIFTPRERSTSVDSEESCNWVLRGFGALVL